MNTLTRLSKKSVAVHKVFGLRMTDYHSGFLVYSRRALLAVPLDRLSGYFDFDLEFIAWASSKGLVIDELAIPTRYAGEVSHLNPIWYGLRALGVMGKYLTKRYGQSASAGLGKVQDRAPKKLGAREHQDRHQGQPGRSRVLLTPLEEMDRDGHCD